MSEWKEKLRKLGLLKAATAWLKHNRPPREWDGDEWSYAYTEMPVWPWTECG